MEIREITVEDIASVLPMYVSYYNGQEGLCHDAARKKSPHAYL